MCRRRGAADAHVGLEQNRPVSHNVAPGGVPNLTGQSLQRHGWLLPRQVLTVTSQMVVTALGTHSDTTDSGGLARGSL